MSLCEGARWLNRLRVGGLSRATDSSVGEGVECGGHFDGLPHSISVESSELLEYFGVD